MDEVPALKTPTWYASIVSRDLREAKLLAEEDRTYENLITVQRLHRGLEKEVRRIRATFKVVTGEQESGQPRI